MRNGARVSREAVVTPAATVIQPKIKPIHNLDLIGYEIAREGAKRKKSWARRWFKTHKPGSFYP